MSLSANIRKRRFELNMTQQELADKMGYKTRSTIAKIESGENDVSQSKLLKFAKVLDTTPEALLTGISSGAERSPSGFDHLPLEVGTETHRSRAAAIILAGGKSSRNRQNIPNQFINILGKPVIVYVLEAYQRHPAIDDIYVVCLKGWENIVEAYAEEYQITKLKGLIPAGPSGILSVRTGLDHISQNYQPDDLVIFQESTRPMVTTEMISKLLQAGQEEGSAIICQSMQDNFPFLLTEGNRARYLDRNAVVDLQSPEAYRFSRIRGVFKRADAENHALVESCVGMLMYKLGYDLNFIEGSVNNIKIVRQEDIAVFTALASQTG